MTYTTPTTAVSALSRLPRVPNIGLISSLCVYARINDLGFIETPYRKVENGKVNMSPEGCVYMSAEEEEDKMVAQANIHLDDDGNILDERISCRHEADFPVVTKDQVPLHGRGPRNQIASIAASLIPFLEHDDANRAPHGIQHDAPGCACHPSRGSYRRHRSGERP